MLLIFRILSERNLIKCLTEICVDIKNKDELSKIRRVRLKGNN